MPESLISPQDSPEARLLIVDDEPHIRSPLVRVLTLLEYAVDEAGSGEEALTLLERTSYDLMVLDMRMPGMDGVEVMYRARYLQPDLLIIVLTGHASVESAIAAVKLEAVDYLRKPAGTREIVDAITRALQKRPKRSPPQQQFEREPISPPPLETPPPASFPYSSSHGERFIHVYPLRLDRQKRLVTIDDSPATSPIEMTKGETAVLASLMAYPGLVLSCQKLVHTAWGYDETEEEAENIIRPYISRLRRKLEVDPKSPRLIHTVRRRGYRFTPTKK